MVNRDFNGLEGRTCQLPQGVQVAKGTIGWSDLWVQLGRTRPEFQGAPPGSDAGLSVMHARDGGLGLSDLAATVLHNSRPGKHRFH